MPRTGELRYYEKIGNEGRRHSIDKPFSDADCGRYLMRVGALMALLPPPPGRVLDCGCGTGWLSYLLQKRGYEVVGTDVSPDAIDLAEHNRMFFDGGVPDFLVADYERLPFQSEFDAVVFFDSLHHALDEQAATPRCFSSTETGWGVYYFGAGVRPQQEIAGHRG